MSWIDELKPASYKGVSFRVDSSSMAFGWNTKVKVVQSGGTVTDSSETEKANAKDSASAYPFIDEGTKGPRVYAVEAHFTGDDYLTTRKSFIDAIEAGGEGVLQLPLSDPIFAYATRASVVYNNRAGGYEPVSVTFIETKKKVNKTTSTNYKRASEDTVEDGEESIQTAVVDVFDSSVTDTDETAETLSTTLLDVVAYGASGDTYSDFVETATEIGDDAGTLIQTPSTYAEKILDALADLTFAFEDTTDAFYALQTVWSDFRASLQTTTNGSEARRVQVVNNLAIALAVENGCVQQMGLAALSAEFDTLDDAVSLRQEYEETVRAQQLLNGSADGWDDMYRILSNLLGSVTKYINSNNDLPSTIDVSFGDENPSFVIAEDYYGDAERTDEVATRNNVRNPLFCNRDLNLLSE